VAVLLAGVEAEAVQSGFVAVEASAVDLSLVLLLDVEALLSTD
jgi:hypothetical protein